MNDIAVIEPLNAVERTELQHREDRIQTKIEEGERIFMAIGHELVAIKEGKLYREYGTFRDYCMKRWQFGDSRGRQIRLALMDYVQLHEALPLVAPEFQNERVFRALRKFPEEYQPVIADASVAVAKNLNKPVTSGLVERAGNVVMHMTNDGTTNGATPVTAELVQQEYEATMRMRQHIADNSKYVKTIAFQEALVVAVDGDDKTIRLSGWDVTPGEIVRISVFVLKQEQAA